MKKAAPSLNSVDTPTNLSAEPSYPNHETVLLSMRDPDWCCHEKSAKCSIEAPHEIKNCGEFSVDTPAPVPERTNAEPIAKYLDDKFAWATRNIELPKGEKQDFDIGYFNGIRNLCTEIQARLKNGMLAAPVPEPEPRRIRCGMCGDTKQQNGYPCPQCQPPARKDELGTCRQFPDTAHLIGAHFGCVNWRPVAPQASPEHDLRKQDTPESKEHWDFVAEATARVEAMPEWKKNSVAVGGSPEAPAKEDAMADFRSWYTQEGSAKFDEISQRHYEPDDCTDTQLIMQEVAELTWARARLGLSGRAE